MSQKLLAKSKFNDKELTLEQHLQDTETACLAIFRGRILDNWCRFFKVTDKDRFLLFLRIACLFHDIGKANLEFVQLVSEGKKFKQTFHHDKQTFRHEWISAFILHCPNLKEWFGTSNLGLDSEIITASVLGHHLQATPKQQNRIDAFGKPRNMIKELPLYLDHPQVINTLQKIATLANLKGLPTLPQQWIDGEAFWENIYNDIQDTAEDFEYEISKNVQRQSLLLAVKGGLIASDSVASGIYRTQTSEAIEEWVNQTLHTSSITAEEIEEKILQPRYHQIEKKTGIPFQLKSFQQEAINLTSRLLLLSACGSGKTIFAYNWAKGVPNRYQIGRVIFLYPTRGTATEGFKDYVSWAPETEASLLTGTANYELRGMTENPTESTKGKDFTTEERLYALGFWQKRFFSATVDQFLSFLTHNYGAICLLPILADSVVIIDEIHSFSRSMFDNLVSFLQHFDIPVLCMTATLPTSRQEELTRRLHEYKSGLEIYPSPNNRSQLEDLEKAETLPRYQINQSNFDEAKQKAIIAYQGGKRILWVVNTVDRCREISTQLGEILETEILTYHSRFRLNDRKKRHEETVNAFQQENTPIIAVTTQVCEMSLDLDAEVLITELAPISALVQRFGRSNRHGKFAHSEILVYEPSKTLPYAKEELEISRQFLHDIVSSHPVSQRLLADKLQEYSLRERFSDGSSHFITGGYWATTQPFRESDDYSFSGILDKDIKEYLQLIEDKNPDAEGLILPITRKYIMDDLDRPAKLPKYLKIASHENYCEKRGLG
ncbi:CRISPR-associated helicase Cas3 [Geminocystis sp. NIES-3708]|uniref:CRISPR-associated helicase/endonuclease Cas3 n=1 Tax=Geminocystis sp. NIES-3708 TaxID=1615909 RepID=UPI0005FCD267|nr:CRISPR-associated helicase/endonuclease Cas3 [Geminocystis sp. NIES-3708]BAQ60820.1 CRISPR-associated helicase Cas3 [Geminocystis sp. NIES-3708]